MQLASVFPCTLSKQRPRQGSTLPLCQSHMFISCAVLLPPAAACFVPCHQALVDCPSEGRRVINFKRLALTDLKVEIPRLASKKVLTEAFKAAGEAAQSGTPGA